MPLRSCPRRRAGRPSPHLAAHKASRSCVRRSASLQEREAMRFVTDASDCEQEARERKAQGNSRATGTFPRPCIIACPRPSSRRHSMAAVACPIHGSRERRELSTSAGNAQPAAGRGGHRARRRRGRQPHRVDRHHRVVRGGEGAAAEERELERVDIVHAHAD